MDNSGSIVNCCVCAESYEKGRLGQYARQFDIDKMLLTFVALRWFYISDSHVFNHHKLQLAVLSELAIDLADIHVYRFIVLLLTYQ